MAQDDTKDGLQSVPVCAVGASAGGIQALKEFFRHVPEDLGLAYVVIIHLAPDHPSALRDILGGVTQMNVIEVGGATELVPIASTSFRPTGNW